MAVKTRALKPFRKIVITLGLAATAGGVALAVGGSWPEDQLLVAAEVAEFDYFGGSIATDGATALIGVHYDDEGTLGNAGSVCVFERSGATWTQVDRLVASDYINSGFFGASVRMSGDSAVFGSYGRDVKKGAAYVFLRDMGVWAEQQKLTASDGASFDNFGSSVAIDGDTVVVGAYGNDHSLLTDPGAAYVFTRNGAVWSLEQKLIADVPGEEDRFGYQVAVSGDTVAIGALEYEAAAPFRTGSVYVFDRSGTSWSQVQKLNGSGGVDDRYFGGTLSLSEDLLVVGSTGTDHSGLENAGVAYVFIESAGVWSEQQRLTAQDAAENDAFGTVARDGPTIVVGASLADVHGIESAGAAYLFSESGGTWVEQQKLVSSDPQDGARLGISVALTSEVLLAGASLTNVSMLENAGAVCFYDWTAQIFTDGFESGDMTAWQ